MTFKAPERAATLEPAGWSDEAENQCSVMSLWLMDEKPLGNQSGPCAKRLEAACFSGRGTELEVQGSHSPTGRCRDEESPVGGAAVEHTLGAAQAFSTTKHSEGALPVAELTLYQHEMVRELERAGLAAKREWQSLPDEPGLYSPCLDVAVGPFAVGARKCGDEYGELARRHSSLLSALHQASAANVARFAPRFPHAPLAAALASNENARCFLAIEIENKSSRKHLMGGAINATALGRLGIAVGWTDEKLGCLIRLRSYLLRLAQFGKNTFDPSNLLILSREQFEEAVCQHARLMGGLQCADTT